jgi:EmrB/QacA subfamily drug resistance transporter
MNSLHQQNRPFLTLVGLMFGVLLSALDGTIVGTAMPKIIGELKGLEHYSLPFTAYMLCATLSIPIFGKLSDVIGRKAIYLAGIALFAASSMLCGASQTFYQLIFFRGIQGIAGGILVSNAFAIVGMTFSPQERGKYIGMVASMFGLASIVGPAAGGLITDVLSWRWIFYINLPLGLAAVILIWSGMEGSGARGEGKKLDVAGTVLFILAFTPLLIVMITGGRDYPWISWQIICLSLFFFVAATAFILIESGKDDPVIPIHFFKNRVFLFSMLGTFLSNVVFFGAILFLPLYMQQVMKNNALLSGFTLTPMMIAFTLASIVAGRVIYRTGKCKTVYVGGFIVAAAGALLLTFVDPRSDNVYIMLSMIVLGIGLGIDTPLFNIMVQNEYHPRDYGTITATVQLFRNIGATFGSAVYGSIMINGLHGGLARINWGGAPKILVDALSNTSTLMNSGALAEIQNKVPPAFRGFFDEIFSQILTVLSGSIGAVFLAMLGFALLALLISLFQKEVDVKTGANAGNQWAHTAERGLKVN